MAHSSRHESDELDARGRRVDDDGRSIPRVAALSTLKEFEVADDTPDPRGWTVIDAVKAEVGKVHDLIVDTVALRTRYLDVELDKDATRLDDDRHVLIPVGLARLDDDHDRVVLSSIRAAQLVDVPPFTHRTVDREYESSLLPYFNAEALGTTTAAESPSTREARAREVEASSRDVRPEPEARDFYDSRHFDDRNFYGKRRSASVDARERRDEEIADRNREQQNEARSIRKREESRRVSEPATSAEQEVTVERIPVANADSPSRADAADDEIRIPVYEDEIVVTKRRVLKEEIVVNKRDAQEGQAHERDQTRDRPDNTDRK
jgi:photosynthetic reaction center H subunit